MLDFILRLSWPATLVLGIFHAWMIYCAHHKLENLTVAEQKVVSLKTENGFYYSYYEEMVSAPTWGAAIWGAMYDVRSEAPDTINAIERFNIHQELLLGSMYRLLRFLVGEELLLDPWYFFRYSLYALNGLGFMALLALGASCGGHGLRGGALPGATLCLLLFLHHRDLSRVSEQSMNNLREFWACPVLWGQTLSLFRLITAHLISSKNPGASSSLQVWRVAFCFCTVGCLLFWQFSAFAFVLQVSGAFLCALLSQRAKHRATVREVAALHLLSAGVAACMLFFNELLVHHLVITQCVAIWLVFYFRPTPRRWKLLFWVDGACAVGIFLALRLVQSPWATADEHIAEIASAKIRKLFPRLGLAEKEPSFNARLYLAVGAFDFISETVLERIVPTGLLPVGAAGAAVWALAFLKNTLFAADPEHEPSSSQTESSTNIKVSAGDAVESMAVNADNSTKDTKSTTGTLSGGQKSAGDAVDSAAIDSDNSIVSDTDGAAAAIPDCDDGEAARAAAFAYGVLLVQTLLFLALGCFIDRLKVLGGPLLCLLAATAFAPQPLEALIGSERAPGSGRFCRWVRRAVFVLAVFGQLAHVVLLLTKLPFLENQAKKYHSDSTWPDADLGELCNWLNQHIPANATIMDSMSLAGQVRALTPHRHVIHPQFESRSLRDRVQEIYKIYQCTPAEKFTSTMKKFRAKYLIVEYKRCDFSPFDLDQFAQFNCKSSTHQWSDLFCVRVHTSPRYRLLFANTGYGVFELRSKRSEKASPAQRSSIADLATWQPMLDRCQHEDPSVCGGRIAELAAVFQEKLKRPEVAQTLFDWVAKTFSRDGTAQYLLGRHHDYELKNQDEAFEYYRKAYELTPNNPYAVREYLMWLDVERQDNRTLERLMRTRRVTKGDRLSLLDLNDVPLACEASVTAKQLMRDADFAEDLWEFAKAEGAGSTCVSTNWPLHEGYNKTMEGDLTQWGLFVDVFWRRVARSALGSSITSVRWQHPRKPWELGVSAVFSAGG